MNMHRALVLSLIGLVLLSGILIILSIWGIGIEPDVIFKILATLGILILIVGFLLVVKMDFGEHKRLKDNDFID
jgi:uncharacterized membrane protein YgdD (TMEM256/DUF423 family)